jgi:hypothetical protein
MADHITERPASKTDARAIAQAAFQLGLQPVPLHSRSKRPAGGPGWNKKIIREDQVDDYFSSGQNVGILWGKPSGGIIDVDLDCDEVVKAGPKLLPETIVYGRANRPSSHFLYRCEDAESTKWLDDDGKMIVEIRSTLLQSVWVGSIHPDGDLYRFDHEADEFTEIDWKDLRVRCGKLAGIALLARAYPSGSGRHDYVHAVAGALYRDGYDATAIKSIILPVLTIASDEKEDDRNQRVRTVLNTITRAEAGGHTRGWNTLKDWLGEKQIERIRGFLIGTTLREMPVITVKSKPNGEDKAKSDQKLPEGLVADIAAWAARRAYVKGAQFDLATGLMCTALASGNRYLIDAWKTPLQPYLMVLAPTGGGKDSTHSTIGEFARRFELRDHLFRGFQSYHAMLDSLVTEPSIACWLWDEAARKLKSAGKATGSQDYQILTHLLEMYGKAHSGIAGMPGRGQAIVAIDRPFLITMATAQPDQMIEAITSADLATGLLARFLLLDCGDELKPLNHERTDLFPAKIDKHVRSFRDVQLNGHGFVDVQFDPPSLFHRFREFAESARKRMDQTEHAELWNRANQNALIIAGLLAIGRDVQHPRIVAEMADFAIEFSTRSVESWISRLGGVSASGDRNERLTRMVEAAVGDPKKYVTRAKADRPKEKALMLKGLMPRGVLYRMVKFDRRRDIDDVIKVLLEGEVIVEGTSGGTHVYRCP